MAERVELDPGVEAEVRSLLREHFTRLGYWNVEQAVTWSLSVEGALSRLDYLRPLLPERIVPRETRVLVSGMGSGSEMLAARRHGFLEVHGTEVDPFHVDLCGRRLGAIAGLYPRLVDGRTVPYAEGFFGLIVSGHIIEHTDDPARYVAEHLRVLAPGGFLLLEFPTRFHHTELHTSLPSLEWLPRPLRDRGLRLLASRRCPLPASVKRRYESILGTGLKQVSLGAVRRFTANAGLRAAVVRTGRVSPGVVYALVERVA